MSFLQRLALAWRILWASSSNTIEHAKRELALAFADSNECLDEEFAELATRDTLEILLVMGTQGHSGFGRYTVRDLVTKLCVHENLTPLQDTVDDWGVVSDTGLETILQHRRCGHVFRQTTHEGSVITYDTEGKIFREPSGATFTSFDSRVPIVFPYTPKREYVNVSADREPDEELRA